MLGRIKESREAADAAQPRVDTERQLNELALQANLAFEAYTASELANSEPRVDGIQLRKGEVA